VEERRTWEWGGMRELREAVVVRGRAREVRRGRKEGRGVVGFGLGLA